MNISFTRYGKIVFADNESVYELLSIEEAEVVADRILGAIREIKKIKLQESGK